MRMGCQKRMGFKIFSNQTPSKGKPSDTQPAVVHSVSSTKTASVNQMGVFEVFFRFKRELSLLGIDPSDKLGQLKNQ